MRAVCPIVVMLREEVILAIAGVVRYGAVVPQVPMLLAQHAELPFWAVVIVVFNCLAAAVTKSNPSELIRLRFIL